MWFRNLYIYRIGQAVDITPEVLEERLQRHAFVACGRMESESRGWAPPLGRHGTLLTHVVNGCVMMCLRREEKLIPAGVIRQMLEERVSMLEDAESRTVYRRERTRLREEIMVDLLPRALTRTANLFGYIDTRNGLLLVDSASATRAEMLVNELRSALGRFPVTPLAARRSPVAVMTQWLDSGSLPDGFVAGAECQLRHPQPDGGVVMLKQQDLASGEVQQHLRHGKQAVRLAVQWRERLSCVLHDDLSVRRLRFEDVVRETAEGGDDDDPVLRFDLDFSLLTLELEQFVLQLVEAFGGPAPDRPAAAAPLTQELAETA